MTYGKLISFAVGLPVSPPYFSLKLLYDSYESFHTRVFYESLEFSYQSFHSYVSFS